jgi:hypothetical protein
MAIATVSKTIPTESATNLSKTKTTELPQQPVLVIQWIKVNGRLESRWIYEVH